MDATSPGNPKCHGLACCIHCQWSPVPRKGMTTYGSTFNANPRTKFFGVYSFWRFLRCSQFHGSRYTKIRQPWWLSRLSNKGKHRSPAASSPPGRWQEPRNGTWSNYVATKHLTMSYRVLQKNSHPPETTEIPCLPPPNFNVVIWSVEHHQQRGTVGTWPLWCGISWDGCFFGRTRYHMINWHYDDDNNKYLTLGHNRNRNNKKNH